jgi:diguanylate cyclase (GGDEF)-like protein
VLDQGVGDDPMIKSEGDIAHRPGARDLIDAVQPWMVALWTMPLVAIVASLIAGQSALRLGATIGGGLMAAGAHVHHRRRPLGRDIQQVTLCLAAAVTVVALTTGGVPTGGGAPEASLTTAAGLLIYPLLVWSILRMARLRRQAQQIDAVVIGVFVALAAGIAAWVALSMRSGSLALAGKFTVVAPVALDVFVLVVMLSLAVAGRRGVAWWAMNGSIGLLCAAHVLVVERVIGSSGSTTIASLACAGACVLLGVSMIHPSSVLLFEPAIIEPNMYGLGHVGVVVVASLAAPSALLLQVRTHAVLPLVITVGASCSSLVLALYIVDLLRERVGSAHKITHDHLTGLPNRILFMDRVERAMAHARRADLPIAVFFIDVDRFKEINDTFGHSAGDLLLHQVATRLNACVRDEDTVARISGDEFAVLLANVSAPGGAVTVAQRMMAAFAQPMTIAEKRVAVTASMGIAVSPTDGTSAEALLASADAAMYRAKDSGRNTYEMFNASFSTTAHERLDTETALLAGLERDELIPYYQPIVDLDTGRIVGAEALVRWNHPELGLLFPGHFVPVAEQSDLVIALGQRVLDSACEAAVRWGQEGLDDLTVAVNVAARQFRFELDRAVTSSLRRSGLDPSRLVLELTESAAVDNIDIVAATLDELRQLGVRAAIDDFGTGYCGLRYLSALNVDTLKIDKSFVQSMTPANASIVAATIAMAHSLGLGVIAEGVETEDQRKFLASCGCDRIQGFLIAKPIPEAEFLDLVRRSREPLRIAEPNGARVPIETSVQREIDALEQHLSL